MGSTSPDRINSPGGGNSSSEVPTEVIDHTKTGVSSSVCVSPSSGLADVSLSYGDAESTQEWDPPNDDPGLVFHGQPDPPSALELRELAKRVNELEAALADITRTLAGPPTEPAIQVDLRTAVEYGNVVVGQIGEALQSGENCTVDAPDLKSFMDGLLGSVQRAGVETVLLAANEILRAPSSMEILRKLAERPPQPTEVADRVTEEITPLDGPGPPTLGLLVLAGALLLAAGVVVPLFAPVIAESILTNEIAIAATAISVAALIKDS